MNREKGTFADWHLRCAAIEISKGRLAANARISVEGCQEYEHRIQFV